MAQPPRNQHDTPRDFTSGVDQFPAQLPAQFPTDLPTSFSTQFPTESADHTNGSQVRVRTHAIRHVAVLEVAGRLGDVVEELDWAIQLALANGPRGVACDLTAVLEDSEPGALERLATAGRHVRDWHGIPVAVASPDPRVREALSGYPLGGQLIVTKSMLSALYAVLRTHSPAVEWLHLAPHPTAPRAARNLVTRTLLDWGLARVIPSACLVVSELVTNSTLYAGTDIDVSIAWNQRELRLTVRDRSAALPRRLHPDVDLHGRGLTIVAGVSRAFGVLPTTDGGKVVWAVLDAPRPDSSRSPSEPAIATKETPMPTSRVKLPTVPATAPTVAATAPHPTVRLLPARPAKSHSSTEQASSARVALATRTTSPARPPLDGEARRSVLTPIRTSTPRTTSASVQL